MISIYIQSNPEIATDMMAITLQVLYVHNLQWEIVLKLKRQWWRCS